MEMPIYPTGPNGHWVFFLVTVLMGGAAAWVTGKAVAQTWRPLVQLFVYCALLTLGVRFLHYALFAEPFLPPAAVAIDFAVLLAAGLLGHRLMRARQMPTQYPWLFEPAGPFAWRQRAPERGEAEPPGG